jgi:hypothetical protein
MVPFDNCWCLFIGGKPVVKSDTTPAEDASLEDKVDDMTTPTDVPKPSLATKRVTPSGEFSRFF